jgi:hypothetical protein
MLIGIMIGSHRIRLCECQCICPASIPLRASVKRRSCEKEKQDGKMVRDLFLFSCASSSRERTFICCLSVWDFVDQKVVSPCALPLALHVVLWPDVSCSARDGDEERERGGERADKIIVWPFVRLPKRKGSVWRIGTSSSGPLCNLLFSVWCS